MANSLPASVNGVTCEVSVAVIGRRAVCASDASNDENIDVSFRYRYIELYRIGRLNINFFDISSCQIFILTGRLCIPK